MRHTGSEPRTSIEEQTMESRHRLGLVMIVAVIAVISVSHGQQPAADSAKIRTDDLLEVGLRDLTAPNTTVAVVKRVDGNGQISLPWVGTLDVKGLTLDELAKRVNIIYAEKKLVQNINAHVKRLESGDNPSIKSGPIKKGDYVQLRIWDLVGPGVVSQYVIKVSDDGTIDLPRAGKCKLEGLSEIDTEKAMIRAYRNANLIQNAMVECLRITEEQAKKTKAE
jgi:protein involved in polysaccharide export with SLBB domain